MVRHSHRRYSVCPHYSLLSIAQLETRFPKTRKLRLCYVGSHAQTRASQRVVRIVSIWRVSLYPRCAPPASGVLYLHMKNE
jgi:hypothetical protein